MKKFYLSKDINMMQVNFILIYIIHKISGSNKMTTITLNKLFSNTCSGNILFSRHIMIKSSRLKKVQK